MILADYHIHSEFSGDSEAPMEHVVQTAIKKGIQTMCFTDHFDKDYPETPEGEEPLYFEFEPDEYFDRIYALRKKYKSDIKILAGVELGLRNEPGIKEGVREFYDKFIDKYDFDFIIGSTHVLENMDPYYKPYWEGRSSMEGLEAYFNSVTENTQYYDGFMVYGHPDYIIRYIPDSIKDYNYADFMDITDIMLKKIIERGKGIEINTSGFKYGLGRPHPKFELLKRYRELGGEIITTGSDAHKSEHVAYDFNRAEELLKMAGFKYYTVFERRKAEFIRL